MNRITYEMKSQLRDQLGQLVITNVRDRSLRSSMNIVRGDTPNMFKKQQYAVLDTLSNEQKEAVCDLLSETISDVIYNFFDMIEWQHELLTMTIRGGDQDYNIGEISDKIGGEMTFDDDTGWIQKFSEIGRFVI